jgi:hypothetical protein
MMLFLSRPNLLVLEFPPLMLNVLEIVNSPAESPKCITTQIEHELEAPARSCRNRIARSRKPDGTVLLGPTVVRGTAGHR